MHQQWTAAARLAAIALVGAALGAPAVGAETAHAAGNASAAAGFIESAQNSDGGFGARKGAKSDPAASLWASVALLAAGKNPRDEFLKNGRSADDYVIANLDRYGSLEQLGLLAMLQYGGRFGVSRYGDPVAKIASRLSADAVRRDPRGASLAILGLVTAGDDRARQTAAAGARALLDTRTSDAAWGPSGNADSASTALALQALAATGAVAAADDAVRGGVAYLKAAQINDGAIAVSTRVDKATSGGSVAATAFAIQALAAFDLPPLRTELGKTVRQGLTQYQQASSGGLTSKGSRYAPTPPSVVETAQAFPAFNGNTFPLRAVASTTDGPEAKKKGTEKSRAAGEGRDTASNRVSSGTASEGVSGAGGDGARSDPGAFEQARAGRGSGGKGAASGDAVEGTVVGAESAPTLKSKAGALDDGLSNQQRATIALGILLAAMAIGGVVLERLRPRPAGAPPLPYAAAAATVAALRPAGRAARRAAGLDARDPATGGPLTARRLWPLAAVGAVGVALIAFPIATGMFDRAPRGATMVEAFAPYMEEQRLASFERDFGQVGAYADEVAGEPVAGKSQSVELFLDQWPAVDKTLGGMLGTIRANKDNYDAVAALPSFTLFPWFFAIPGVLLVLLAAAGLALARRRPRAWVPIRRAAVALGVGLLLAPVAFQMFDRAPKGAAMVEAFATIETRSLVQDVQGHFGTIAVGQGAVAAELFPALEARGLSSKEIARRLPASATLNDRWVRILNNLTPMIGVMSDNVGNYRAVAAMPPFGLFPWLFVVAGLAALGFALLAGRVAAPGPDPAPTPPESPRPAEPPSPPPPGPPTPSPSAEPPREPAVPLVANER